MKFGAFIKREQRENHSFDSQTDEMRLTALFLLVTVLIPIIDGHWTNGTIPLDVDPIFGMNCFAKKEGKFYI